MGLGGMVLLLHLHLPAHQKGPPPAATKILPIFVADEAAAAAAADGGGGGDDEDEAAAAAVAVAAAAGNYQSHCLASHSANLLTPSTPNPSKKNFLNSQTIFFKNKNTPKQNLKFLYQNPMFLFSFFCNSGASSCTTCFSREREREREGEEKKKD